VAAEIQLLAADISATMQPFVVVRPARVQAQFADTTQEGVRK
jgi:hypothetical protein